MDYHHASLALHEWLEEQQPQEQQPELAYFCQAINPATNEVIWDDWIYSRKDRLLRIREAEQDGLTLTIEATPDEVWA